jgi:hypothetical protein
VHHFAGLLFYFDRGAGPLADNGSFNYWFIPHHSAIHDIGVQFIHVRKKCKPVAIEGLISLLNGLHGVFR